MRTRHSVLALALLIVLSGISACKRKVTTTVSTTGDIELSPYHTPDIYVFEGQVLRVRPSSGDLTLTFDQGLCTESGPVRGTPDHAAVCTIAKQDFRGRDSIKYTLTVAGSDGVPYNVYVKPCKGCIP